MTVLKVHSGDTCYIFEGRTSSVWGVGEVGVGEGEVSRH